MRALGDMQVVGVDDSLSGAKAIAYRQLQACKADALAAMPYVVSGQTYQVTLTAQDQIDVQTQIAILTAAPAGTTIPWEIVDGVFLTWQLADVQALQSAGIAYVQAAYANAKALGDQINAAPDVATLSAIDPTQGWPS